ncbi:MAG: glycosyltransferase family 2 protein [Pyrinomonadaceae bacterium]|nr:glycosyltransferase family 2 protein [Pyrinomonadaceae bacterium]
MIYIFYFFAAVIVFLGWQSWRGGILYLDFFKRELAKPKSNYTPFCSIIAPCRGLDEDLQANLAALFNQDFPNYEIIFVVDDEGDEAVKIIQEVSRQGAKSAKLIIAGKANNESQKVHNLRQAVLEVADESKVFVFVDSDARPNENWLRNLVASLENEKIGCATGYRWFISKKISFASELRSVWNASVASALGANLPKNFCWGGSLAMRRETFERLDVREKWRGTLSDDFAVTRMMKTANLPIYFVPQALTATVENCNFRELLEFTTRQMKITRVYAEHLWKASLIGSFVFSIVFWAGIALLFFVSGGHFWLTLSLMLVIFALGAGKAFVRLKAVKLVLKDYEKELNRQIFSHLILWTITPPLYFYNCVCALFSSKIVWRGIEYELKSATETVILSTKESLN